MDTKKKLFAAIVTCAIGLAAPIAVNAMDAADWQGFYAGVNAGTMQATNVTNTLSLGSSEATTQPYDMTGYTFGIQGGYNWGAGPVVIGVVGNASSGSADGEKECVSKSNVTCGSKVDNLMSLRARVGYPIGKFLIYGTIGMAQADIKAWFGTDGNSGTQDGTVYGIGGEFAFTPNLVGRVELATIDFGTNNYPFVASGNTYNYTVATKLDTARFGVSLKF